MTHDELLARIKDDEVYEYFRAYPALRAVLELHPKFMNSKDEVVCCHCFVAYPCPTIQAIEKELAVG